MVRIIAAGVPGVLLAGLCLAVETHALTSYFDLWDKVEKEQQEKAKYLTKEELACAADGNFVRIIAAERDSGQRVTETLLRWRQLRHAFGGSAEQDQRDTELILTVFQQPHTPAATLVAKVEIDCLSRAHRETDSVPTTATPLR